MKNRPLKRVTIYAEYFEQVKPFLRIKKERNTNRTHGMSGTLFYKKWGMIRARTTNKERHNYKNYGGKGIRVCERWLKFENFKADMYESYLSHFSIWGREDTTLDRLDNSKDYSPENCRWATRKQQSENINYSSRPSTRVVVFKNKEYSISGLAKELGIPYKICWGRLKHGTLFTNPKRGKRQLNPIYAT